jgi:hypothetical protein
MMAIAVTFMIAQIAAPAVASTAAAPGLSKTVSVDLSAAKKNKKKTTNKKKKDKVQYMRSAS